MTNLAEFNYCRICGYDLALLGNDVCADCAELFPEECANDEHTEDHPDDCTCDECLDEFLDDFYAPELGGEG